MNRISVSIGTYGWPSGVANPIGGICAPSGPLRGLAPVCLRCRVLTSALLLRAPPQLLVAASAAGYSYLCQPVDYSDDVNSLRVSAVTQYATRNTQHTTCNTHNTHTVCTSIHPWKGDRIRRVKVRVLDSQLNGCRFEPPTSIQSTHN